MAPQETKSGRKEGVYVGKIVDSRWSQGGGKDNPVPMIKLAVELHGIVESTEPEKTVPCTGEVKSTIVVNNKTEEYLAKNLDAIGFPWRERPLRDLNPDSDNPFKFPPSLVYFEMKLIERDDIRRDADGKPVKTPEGNFIKEGKKWEERWSPSWGLSEPPVAKSDIDDINERLLRRAMGSTATAVLEKMGIASTENADGSPVDDADDMPF
jgi:hypothetical protein